jgi:hypothetical protein
MDARAKGRAEQFFDLHYGSLVADPMAAVEAIYRHFRFRLSEEARARMRAYLANNPQHKHGAHRYALEDFGLDAKTVGARFRRYTEQFCIASAGSARPH